MTAPRGGEWQTPPSSATTRSGGNLAARALAAPPPYRPLLGSPACHISADDQVILAAGHDLRGPPRDLVTAVMAPGGEVLATTRTRRGHPDARRIHTATSRLDSGDVRDGTRFEWDLRGFGKIIQELQEFSRPVHANRSAP